MASSMEDDLTSIKDNLAFMKGKADSVEQENRRLKRKRVSHKPLNFWMHVSDAKVKRKPKTLKRNLKTLKRNLKTLKRNLKTLKRNQVEGTKLQIEQFGELLRQQGELLRQQGEQAKENTELKDLIIEQAKENTELKDLIIEQAKENTELKDLIIELAKENTELKDLIIELAKEVSELKYLTNKDAEIWGADYIYKVAGEIWYWILRKQPPKVKTKGTSTSKDFKGWESRRTVAAIAKVMALPTGADFCRLAERCIDCRNHLSCHFPDLTKLQVAVKNCATLFERHGNLASIGSLGDQKAIIDNFEDICREFHL